MSVPASFLAAGEARWTSIGSVEIPRSFLQVPGRGETVARDSGVQVTPDSQHTLVSKKVGGERWVIAWNHTDGTVTGNVHSEEGVDFLSCSDESTEPDSPRMMLSCSVASPQPTADCSVDSGGCFHAWVVARDHHREEEIVLFGSTDGARTWKTLRSFLGRSLSVSWGDRSNGWGVLLRHRPSYSVPESTRVLRTRDGGAGWSDVTAGFPQPEGVLPGSRLRVWSIDFTTRNVGLGSGDYPDAEIGFGRTVAMTTVDGGETWTFGYVTPGSFTLGGCITTTGLGFLVGSPHFDAFVPPSLQRDTFTTNDFGLTWARDGSDGYFCEESRLWRLDGREYTEDGTTWIRRNEPEEPKPDDEGGPGIKSFVDEWNGVGLIGVRDDTNTDYSVVRTADGGRTWLPTGFQISTPRGSVPIIYSAR